MHEPYKIWLALDSRTTGGIETHVMQLALGLKQAGQQVEVIFIKAYGAHPLIPLLQQKGIETTSLDGRFLTITKRIKTSRPDVIHSHGYKAGLLCRLAARLTSTIHISTYHAGEINRGKLAVYDWIDRYTAWLNHQSFTVNMDIARRLPTDSRVMDNFIAIPEIEPKADKQIAFVGRLSHEKGPDHILRLAARLPATGFHFYGSGPMEQDLKQRSTGNCIFHGNQSAMDDNWKNIDLLIMPSRFEGLPMVAMEAMARQIPVVAFDVGAMSKLVLHEHTGWLVPPGRINTVQQIVERWLKLDDQQKTPVRLAAGKHIEDNFSSGKMIPRIQRVYTGLILKKYPTCDAFCK
jgi:glycosyltransferase involved in cell wall biosynthesis